MPKGEAIDKTEAVDVWTTNTTYKGRSVAYKDIAFKVPDGGKTPTDEEYTYTANDMSVGDLDGDGEYEYIVKWDPSNSRIIPLRVIRAKCIWMHMSLTALFFGE